MNGNENRTMTYIDPSSNRPILKSIHDKGAQSVSDENINFVDVLETLSDVVGMVDANVFIDAFEGEYNEFVTLLNQALSLRSHVRNLDEILLISDQMYHMARRLPPTVCATFVITQLKPFLKEERYG